MAKLKGKLAGSGNTGPLEHEPEALNHPKLPRTRNSPDPKLPKHDAPKPEALLMGQYKNIPPTHRQSETLMKSSEFAQRFASLRLS